MNDLVKVEFLKKTIGVNVPGSTFFEEQSFEEGDRAWVTPEIADYLENKKMARIVEVQDER